MNLHIHSFSNAIIRWVVAFVFNVTIVMQKYRFFDKLYWSFL
jgi:hypothetical protein